GGGGGGHVVPQFAPASAVSGCGWGAWGGLHPPYHGGGLRRVDAGPLPDCAAHTAAGRLRLAEGSLTALPLDTDSLDAAITCNTIYFVTDLPAACAELARVVRPGGRLVIGIGDPDVMNKIPFTGYGFTLRPIAEVIDTLSAAGCTVEHRRIPNPPIPFHMLIARPAAS
ncbi:class I SAM-dependent methyltransferase, partial [Nocardia cyriacigeorgica]|uniref:class I SAM-dependent methyltransferase n=1 Tax=Nocardia cyriacigeorgica TaxID=135487 RepID=UPI002457F32A